eukprot:tig00001181_g7420.t1
MYISEDRSMLWLVDYTGARGFNGTDALRKMDFSGLGEPPSPSGAAFVVLPFGKYGPRFSRNGRFVALWKSLVELQILDLEDGANAFDNARTVPVDLQYVNSDGLLPAQPTVSDDGMYLALRYVNAGGNFAVRVIDLKAEALISSACSRISRSFEDSELKSVYGSANRTSRWQERVCAAASSSKGGASAAGADAALALRAPAAPIVRVASSVTAATTSGARQYNLHVFVFNTVGGSEVPTTASVTCQPKNGGEPVLTAQLVSLVRRRLHLILIMNNRYLCTVV